MYYDKDFFDWYRDVYLLNKDKYHAEQRKLAANKRKKVAALQKSIADNQALIEYLTEKKITTHMEALAIRLKNHKTAANLTFSKIAKRSGTSINAIQKHLNNEIKYRGKHTKAIEKYLANSS
jgi:hypothetical protein